MISQTAAIFAAGHESFEHVIRALGKTVMAELDLRGTDDDLAGITRRHGLWRERYQIGAVKIRHINQTVVAFNSNDFAIHQRRVPDKRCDKRMQRTVVDFVRRAVLENFAAVHHHDRIGDRKSLVLIMSHVERADADFFN